MSDIIRENGYRFDADEELSGIAVDILDNIYLHSRNIVCEESNSDSCLEISKDLSNSNYFVNLSLIYLEKTISEGELLYTNDSLEFAGILKKTISEVNKCMVDFSKDSKSSGSSHSSEDLLGELFNIAKELSSEHSLKMERHAHNRDMYERLTSVGF